MTPPILQVSRLSLREIIWGEAESGNDSYKDQGTQKPITVHETSLQREESEGGGGSPLVFTPNHSSCDNNGPSGETSGRKESFAPQNKRIKTAECPPPPPQTTELVLRNSLELSKHAHAHDPSSGPCTLPFLPPQAKPPVTKRPFNAPGAPTFCSKPGRPECTNTVPFHGSLLGLLFH